MALRTPSLRAIAAFEAAARHQNFSKAAEELNLSQSAISHAIRSLEVRLGQTLFERSGRRVELTELGQLFAGRIRLSMSLLSSAFEVAPTVRKAKLTVSIMPAFADLVLRDAIWEYLSANPHLEIELRATARLADLSAEDVDVGIRHGPGGWANLTSKRIGAERLFPAASPHYRDGDLPRTPEDLERCDIIHHAHFPWRMWLEAAGYENLNLPRRILIDDSALNIAMAEKGCGVALVRGLLAHEHLAAGRLVKLFDASVVSGYSYHCVWDPASPRRDLIEKFVAWVAQITAERTR